MIKIDNPCSEDWDKMTTIKDGKFCAHCKEQVVDFANLSDAEIARLIEKNKGPLCGRFNREQLGREIAVPAKANRFSFITKAAATFLLFISGKEVGGQSNQPSNSSSVYADKLSTKNTSFYNNTTPIEIAGTVFDASTNKPITNARIIIAKPFIAVNFPISYKTDNDGSFSIVLPDSTEKRTIELIIAAEGYQESTVKISSEDYSTQINVYLSSTSNTENVVLQVYSPPIKRKDVVLGGITSISYNDISNSKKHTKKHFNFWNLFRSKKNRK